MAKRHDREERKEGQEEVRNDVPGAKMQEEQQIADSTGFKVGAGESKFKPEKKKAPGSQLKQEVAASVIHDAQLGGSNSGDGVSFSGTRSSGSVGGILGAGNATPVAAQARGDSRTTKKLDRNSTKLNYIPSDQVLVEWDESKPLADSSNEDQGFNGTYRNEFARLQKTQEAVPGALMFDRSVDLLVKDNIYFGQGQVVRLSGTGGNNADLRITAVPNATTGVYGYPDESAGPVTNYDGGITDNYLCKGVDLLFTASGQPAYCVYDEEALTCSVDQYEANKSSAQDHILMNDAEIVRETMDSKAGDEKADIWTPLARAVRRPTQVVGFLRDIEAGVGDEIITAYRKFGTSMAFQLNRAHKDGQNPKDPAVFALTGLNYNFVSYDAAKTALGDEVSSTFTRAHYLNGDASTMIALYDSTGKYNSKADVILQPRSFRMHLQTADNNMDPLHTSKLFNQAYDVEEVFSTIDREYDPMSPVCMTDKAGVVHRISWHKMGSYIYNNINFVVNKVTTGGTARNDFVLVPAAMVDELKAAHLNVYLKVPTEDAGTVAFSSNTFKPSTNYEFEGGEEFDMIIAATDPSSETGYAFIKAAYASMTANAPIIWNGVAKNNVRFDVHEVSINDDATKVFAYHGGPAIYLYADLRNHYVCRVAHPLTEGFEKYLVESIGAKYHTLITGRSDDNYPVRINTIHSTMFYSLWSIMLCAATPWIIRERINSFRDLLYYEKNVEYPYSFTLQPVKDVLTKSYSNFGYVNYDTELEVKRMTPIASLPWCLPEMYQQVGYGSSLSQVLMPWYTNQVEIRYINGSYMWDDDASAMSFPSIRSGVRFAALDNLYGMTEKDVRLSIDKIASFKNLSPTLSSSHTYKYSTVGDGQLILAVAPAYMDAKHIMCLPRELGFFMTAPYGTLTPTYAHARDYTTTVLGTSGFRAYYWIGKGTATATDSSGTEQILKALAININRAANFEQKWFCVLASGTVPSIDHGFVLSANQAFGADGSLLAGRTSFHPFCSLADNAYGVVSTNMNAFRSLQKVLWTRIQKLPFILSPFDLLTLDNTGSPNAVVLNDPYDFLYAFGLGGFRASDYRESVYNREKQVVNQGITFVSDPWVAASPLFKEGAVAAGIKQTKGFEL